LRFRHVRWSRIRGGRGRLGEARRSRRRRAHCLASVVGASCRVTPVGVEVGLVLKGLAPIHWRNLGQNRKSVMKVVTPKNIPEVPAPGAATNRRMDIPGPCSRWVESQQLRRNPANGRKRRNTSPSLQNLRWCSRSGKPVWLHFVEGPRRGPKPKNPARQQSSEVNSHLSVINSSGARLSSRPSMYR